MFSFDDLITNLETSKGLDIIANIQNSIPITGITHLTINRFSTLMETLPINTK